MALILTWRGAVPWAVSGEDLRPDLLSGHSATEVARQPIAVGNGTAAIGDLFGVEGDPADGVLVLEGDLRSCRGVASGMAGGRLTIRGDVGPELGVGMSGGEVAVIGSVGDSAGAEMRGGMLRIRGRAGDSLGAALPGSRVGMREGVILVEGPIGDDAGLALRRGLIAVGGPVGGGLGRGMVAGSILAFGPVGPRTGAGMKRGTIALFGPEAPPIPPTFHPSGRLRPPFLAIYLRRLRAWGFPVPEAAFAGPVLRYNGDRVGGGQGEILVGRAG